MLLTEPDPSPQAFRLWTAITLVGGALERRVWAKAYARYLTFPNLYTLLTSGPGVGKQVISTAKHLWREAKEPGTTARAFRIAPSQMTKASLVDRINKSKNTRLTRTGTITYSCLLVAAEEFQVLLPSYDTEYIATLNEVFNNPEYYDEERRTGSVRELHIERPQLTILGGVQPSYFVSTFPEEAWTTGFARRIIMIYAAEGPSVELFGEESYDAALQARAIERLSAMAGLYGQMSWAPDAAGFVAKQHRSRIPPVPEHSKLVHYNNSRSMFLIKLATISAVARTGALLIELIDAQRALRWLLDAEARMPDVFREMTGKSDSAVIDELHYFATKWWAQNDRQPLSTAQIWAFLRQRVPSEKIERVFRAAENSGMISRRLGTEDQWVPQPKLDPGATE